MKNQYALFSYHTFTVVFILFSHLTYAGSIHDKGLSKGSADVELNNQTPIVVTTSPVYGSVFTPGSPITIAATAVDMDGRITKVEFFNGNIKLGEDLTAPYSYTWTGAALGTYSLTVKATDNSNAITTSNPVVVKVNTNTYSVPTVSILSPSKGSSFTLGTPIKIDAAAADINGKITKMEFFIDGIKLAEDLTAPYSYSWTGVTTGTYSLTVKATDNSNLTITSNYVLVIISKPDLPTVSITSPAQGSTFITANGAPNITITTSVTNMTSKITKMEFYTDEEKLGEDLTAPYSYTWTGVAAGTYSLMARAIDNTNRTITSNPVIVTIAANYCKPSYPRGCYGFYINNFSFNTLKNNDSGCNEGISILSSKTTTVSPGRRYPIQMQSGGDKYSHFGVWIDYNQDKDFDDEGEFVYGTFRASKEVVSGAITISPTAALGQTRMRVETSMYDISGWYSECRSNNLGETEDYTITITPLTQSGTSARIIPTKEESLEKNETIFQSYPNPFTHKSTIEFAFAQDEDYQVMIYTMTGSFVKALSAGHAKANTLIQVEWADEKIPPGVYLVRLTSTKDAQNIRVVRQ